MPLYGYRCSTCGRQYETLHRTTDRPCVCGGRLVRDYSSVSIRPSSPFRPHFSYTTGAYVSTLAEFKDQLKYCAERNSLATGIDHEYEYRDPDELKRRTPPSDTEILEESARLRRGGATTSSPTDAPTIRYPDVPDDLRVDK